MLDSAPWAGLHREAKVAADEYLVERTGNMERVSGGLDRWWALGSCMLYLVCCIFFFFFFFFVGP